jgi:O-antigen/teichoic acid export membrane protein
MILAGLKREIKHGKNLMVFMILKAMSLGVLAIIPFILAGFFGPEKFGVYSLAMMVIYFFSALLIHSLIPPFTVYGNKELKETNKIRRVFTVSALLFILAVILFLLFALVLYKPLLQFISIDKNQFLFLILAFMGLSIQSFTGSLFMAMNKRISSVTYGLISNIILVGYILILLKFFTIDLENVFLMWLIAPILAATLMLRKIDFKKLIPLELNKGTLKKVFNYSKWIMIGGTAVYFVNWGDNLVLRYFASLEQIGVYNLGYSVFKGLLMLISTTAVYFLPFITQNIDNPDKIEKYLHNKRPKIILLWTLCVLALYFTLPYLLNILYGKEYSGSATVAQILLVATLFAVYWRLYDPIFNAMERYRFTQIANVFFVILNLGLDVIFVIYYGYIGAAIATMISYGVMGIIYEVYFRKYCKPVLSK